MKGLPVMKHDAAGPQPCSGNLRIALLPLRWFSRPWI